MLFVSQQKSYLNPSYHTRLYSLDAGGNFSLFIPEEIRD